MMPAIFGIPLDSSGGETEGLPQWRAWVSSGVVKGAANE